MQHAYSRITLTIMMLFIGFTLSAQSYKVTGRVLDAKTSAPLIGVNILVKGTSTGTQTDVNGKFTISVPNASAVLEIRYIGYTSTTVEVGKRKELEVQLEESRMNLDEVVVVGYGAQKKESVIGAISTLNTKDITKTPANNITQAIAGKIPGVITVQTQGQPGADGAQIYIRGRASFASDNSPLVLVDGIERAYNDVPAEDVAQISVLKDASATAVYGVRGANGVILITTKRGQEGKIAVSFSGDVSVQTPTRLNSYLNSYNSVVLLEEALKNDGLPSQYSADDIAKYKLASEGKLTGNDTYLYPNVDWYKAALKKAAITQQYSVNVTGGTKRMSYYTSLSYLDQGGLYKDFKSYDYGQSSKVGYKRYSFRTNLDFKLTSLFTASINFGTRFEDRQGPNVTEGTTNQVFYELNHTPGWLFPIQWADGTYGGSSSAKNNIIGRLAKGGFYSKTSNVNETNIALNHDLGFITKGLSAKVMGSFDYYSDYDRRFSAGVATYELINRNGSLNDPNNFRRYNQDTPLTYAGNTQYTSMKTYLEAGLNYSRLFNNVHEITAMALYNQNSYRWQGDIPYRYQGIVGRATYNYDRRYFAEMNFGFNGSENFAKGNRFGFFPSVSLGWMITNEAFMKQYSWIDVLKLRTSYGEVGNDKYSNARFLYVSSWIQGGGYIFGDSNTQPGIYEGQLPNLDVTWERAKKYNLAIESAFLGQTLNVNADFFYEKRSGILTNYLTIPDWTAVTVAPANLGKTTNKGIEVEAKYHNTIGSFNYFVNTAFSVSKNNIVFKDEPAGMPSWQKKEGHPINQYYGLVSEGYFTSTQEIAAAPKQTFGPVQVGDLKYRDINKDGVIDDRDVTFIGNSDIPTNTYNLTFGGDYKGFNFSVMFYGVTGVSRYYDAEALFAFSGGGKVRSQHMDRWQPDQSVEYNLANAKYPLLHYDTYGNNNQRLNSFFLKNGNFLRLKNVELGYNLPKKVCQRVLLSEIRVYMNGSNLYTWDKLDDLADPESTGSNAYPIMKVFNLGLKVKF